MSKRSLSEAAPESVERASETEERRSKKQKKESKKTSSGRPVVCDDASTAKADKAARKALKRANLAAESDQTNGVAAEGDEKAEKAARRAKKEAKKSKEILQESNGSVSQKSAALGDYAEDAELSRLPQSEIDDYISKQHIARTDPRQQDSTPLRPIISFKYLPITDEALRTPLLSYESPTPIQAAAWPYLFAKRDVVGVAETGSGKTVAFGLPCIQYIGSLPASERRDQIKACVVSPTRELALQIYEQLLKLATPAGLKVGCAYGGVNKNEQLETLDGIHIIVATPGRLNDFIDQDSIDLSKVTYLVLDEADRMLDTGFEKDVRKIAESTSKTGRQTLMFTATWPPAVEELASTFMKAPVRITIGDNPTGELRANTRITQEVEVLDSRDKNNRLLEILRQYQSGKNKSDRILVFCLYKKEASRVEGFISSRGFKVAGIHGDMTQQQRTASLESFKQGSVPLLVATDVAARGLDIPAVKLVLNVTFPLTIADYVHRIGRTGRAGQAGHAITFFTDHEKTLAGGLINILKAANQNVPDSLLKFGTTVKKKEHDTYGAFYKDPTQMKKATKITFD